VRKVRIDDIRLDIVIPNIHTVRNFPDKAIVIRILDEGGLNSVALFRIDKR